MLQYYFQGSHYVSILREIELSSQNLFYLPSSDGSSGLGQKIGTATNVRYRRHFFTIFTRHQLRNSDVPVEDLQSLAIPSGRKDTEYMRGISFYCPAESSNDPLSNPDGDRLDFAALCHHPEVSQLDNFANSFFDLDFFPGKYIEISPPAFCIGFPNKLTQIEHDFDTKNFSSKISWISLPYIIPLKSLDTNLETGIDGAQFFSELPFHPDGISGSPVFGMSYCSGGMQAILLGIVLRGGRKSLRFLNQQYIVNHLDDAISKIEHESKGTLERQRCRGVAIQETNRVSSRP